MTRSEGAKVTSGMIRRTPHSPTRMCNKSCERRLGYVSAKRRTARPATMSGSTCGRNLPTIVANKSGPSRSATARYSVNCESPSQGSAFSMLCGISGIGSRPACPIPLIGGVKMNDVYWKRFALLSANPHARSWLSIQADLQLAPNTLIAYGRALEDYLSFCARNCVDADNATREHLASFVRDLAHRPNPRGKTSPVANSTPALPNPPLPL